MKQCPNGHEVGSEAKFCPICGAEIMDNGTTYCAKCGNERKGTEKFCSQCGTPFGASPIPGNNRTRTSKKSSKKGIIIASVVCLLMLAAGGAAWYFLQKDKYSLEGLALAAVNYDWIDNFHDGMAVVYKGENYGYIDKMGNEVIPCIYDFTEESDVGFHDGLALVRKDGKFFFINREGKEAFPFIYETASAFSEGLATVWKDGKCGYIDTKGNEVIPLTDKFSGDNFSDGLAAVWKGEKYGYIDKKGNLVIPMQYEYDGEAPSFSEGLAPLLKNGKWGYIDNKGNEVISCKYEMASSFSEGLAAVDNGNGWGYIDKNGNEVIPCRFDYYVGSFSEGYAVVSKDGKSFFINKKGEKVFSYSFKEQYGIFHDGLAKIKKDTVGLFVGYIDKNGKEIIPCIYNSYNDFSEGLAVVEKDGIYGFVDKKGNSTFDIQNEDVKRVVQTKIKEKEEERIKEEERQKEEERERERRRGVEKVVSLSFTRRENGSIADMSGNYGANVWKGMFFTYDGYVMTDFIRIPNGKVWVYDRWERVAGSPGTITLLYNSRDSNTDGPRYYDQSYEIQRGGLPIFRAGDRIRVTFNPYHDAETKTVRVYFKEKDEDVVY